MVLTEVISMDRKSTEPMINLQIQKRESVNGIACCYWRPPSTHTIYCEIQLRSRYHGDRGYQTGEYFHYTKAMVKLEENMILTKPE